MKSALVISAGLLWAGAAYADEVIIHRDAPAVVEPAAPSTTTTTTTESHGVGCDSRTVHSENDAGDSKTVTQENCD